MLNQIEIARGVYYVGAVDWNLRDFHGYNTPRGVTYNSYLIVDEKICLIDNVKAPYSEELLERVSQIVDPAKIDYVITNHVEPDHSGSLPKLMERAPQAKVVLTNQGRDEVIKYYGKEYDFMTVKQGDVLAELEVEKMAGGNVDSKIAQLNKQLEGNLWDELVKDGQYTALVENIDLNEKGNGQLGKMLQNYIDEHKYSEMINTVKDALYINQTHNIYGVLLKTVHYGDAITRQIIKEELEEKMYARWAKKHNLGEATKEAVEDFIVGKPALISEYKKEKQSILNYLDQLLVNYGYIPNGWWNYAERVTGLLFMKYYLNQPKAIMSMIKKSPTRIALMQGTQAVTGVNVADPFNTYQKSALDGIAYRWMLDDAPERVVEPNVFHLIPRLSSIFTIN